MLDRNQSSNQAKSSVPTVSEKKPEPPAKPRELSPAEKLDHAEKFSYPYASKAMLLEAKDSLSQIPKDAQEYKLPNAQPRDSGRCCNDRTGRRERRGDNERGFQSKHAMNPSFVSS